MLAMSRILFTIAMYNLFTVNEDYIKENTSMHCSCCSKFYSIFIRSSARTSISGSFRYVNHFLLPRILCCIVSVGIFNHDSSYTVMKPTKLLCNTSNQTVTAIHRKSKAEF